MSRWTHLICAECYAVREPERRPHRLSDDYNIEFARDERCCFCGERTDDGIYYRADPATTLCKGVHAEDLRLMPEPLTAAALDGLERNLSIYGNGIEYQCALAIRQLRAQVAALEAERDALNPAAWRARHRDG